MSERGCGLSDFAIFDVSIFSSARREGEDAEATPRKSKKGKSKFKSKGMKKPKGGKGQRNPNKRTLGRKRR